MSVFNLSVSDTNKIKYKKAKVLTSFITDKGSTLNVFIGYRTVGSIDKFKRLAIQLFNSPTNKKVNNVEFSNIDLSSIPNNSTLQLYFTNTSTTENEILYFMPPIVLESEYVIPIRQIDNYAQKLARTNKLVIDKIQKEVLTIPVPITNDSTVLGSYIGLKGNTVEHSDYGYKEYNISGYLGVRVYVRIFGAQSVSAISLFNSDNKLIAVIEKGTISSTVTYTNDIFLSEYKNASILRVCTNNSNIDTIFVNKLTAVASTAINAVQTWGDSITAAGKYQNGIAAELKLSTIKNAGIASDFSMHVRNRFISYFTEESPYVGTGTYTIPALEERKN